jgi:hypothetical protein
VSFEEQKLLFMYLLWDWGLNARLHACKAGVLPLEPHLRFISFWLFLEMVSHDLFAWAGLKLQPS